MGIQQQKPILTVGAGPVGLTVALELARRNQPVRIIEAKIEASNYSKAIGINPRTLELLEPAGVTERLLGLGIRISRVRFAEAQQKLFELSFSGLVHRYNFMLGLPQSETERVLEKRLNEMGVEVERGMTFKQLEQMTGAVVARVETATGEDVVETPYLIGCDGAHSAVREQLGISFPGHDLPGKWSLADVRMETSLDPEAANLILQPDGILFAIRFKPGLFRVASNRSNVLERLPRDSQVSEVLWQSDFRVSHRLVERYSRGRVFLAGDAAHIHSPLGGRGMNLGIEDAATLAQSVEDFTLEGYHRQRHDTAAAVIRMVRAQTWLATSNGLGARATRKFLVPNLLRMAPVRTRLTRRMLGLGKSRQRKRK